MRTKLIAGNWKMHKTIGEAVALIDALHAALPTIPADRQVIVCPTFTALAAVAARPHGAIGIGMSQSVDYGQGSELDWTNSRRFGAAVIRGLIREAKGRDTYFNVNIPYCPPEEVTGVRVVPRVAASAARARARMPASG